MPKNKDSIKKNKVDDVLGGGRTSLYFAPSEHDLLDFVNSQKVKRNKFIINLIREAYEQQKSQQVTTNDTDKVSNEDLLNEIKSLKIFIENHSLKIDKTEVEETSDETSNVLPLADDKELMQTKFDDSMDDL